MWIVLPLQLLFVDPNELFSTPCVFPKAVISDPIKPGREARFAAKTADMFVGTQKSFLSKIISESDVRPRKLAQQTAHARLMPANQLAKSVLVVIDKNSSNQVRIG
jgi:hypothetical protein